MELLDQPANSILNTLKEEITIIYNKSRLNVKVTLNILKGITTQLIKLRNNVKNGAKKNKILCDFKGIIISLESSFKPSANGCKNPHNPTTLGPFRRWIAAIILRSAKVKKAIESNKGIKTKNV